MSAQPRCFNLKANCSHGSYEKVGSATLSSDRVCVAADSNSVAPIAIGTGAGAFFILLILLLAILLVARQKRARKVAAAVITLSSASVVNEADQNEYEVTKEQVLHLYDDDGLDAFELPVEESVVDDAVMSAVAAGYGSVTDDGSLQINFRAATMSTGSGQLFQKPKFSKPTSYSHLDSNDSPVVTQTQYDELRRNDNGADVRKPISNLVYVDLDAAQKRLNQNKGQVTYEYESSESHVNNTEAFYEVVQDRARLASVGSAQDLARKSIIAHAMKGAEFYQDVDQPNYESLDEATYHVKIQENESKTSTASRQMLPPHSYGYGSDVQRASMQQSTSMAAYGFVFDGRSSQQQTYDQVKSDPQLIYETVEQQPNYDAIDDGCYKHRTASSPSASNTLSKTETAPPKLFMQSKMLSTIHYGAMESFDIASGLPTYLTADAVQGAGDAASTLQQKKNKKPDSAGVPPLPARSATLDNNSQPLSVYGDATEFIRVKPRAKTSKPAPSNQPRYDVVDDAEPRGVSSLPTYDTVESEDLI